MKPLKFDVFDTRKIDEYAEQAKAAWGNTPAYREYEQKSKGRSKGQTTEISNRLMDIFAEFGAIKSGKSPDSAEAQALVGKLRDFISAHFYTCTVDILRSLGMAYAGGGEMTANINRYAGEGTAEFAGEAVRIYCGKQ